MKRGFTQIATKVITLTRDIIVDFPDDVHPDAADDKALDALLESATVEWEVDDEEFDLDSTDWFDPAPDATPHVVYEE